MTLPIPAKASSYPPEAFLGYFQAFRPDGDGLLKAMEGVPDAALYVDRLKPVYVATQGSSDDMYFIVRNPMESSESELKRLGHEFISKLRILGMIIEDDEFNTYLADLHDVRVVAGEELDQEADANLLVLETIGDWTISKRDRNDSIPAMREAFYSVACDFLLKHYLQWPYFRDVCDTDVFHPYFELWSRGIRVAFDEEALNLSRDTSMAD